MVDSFSETYADDEKHLETWLPSDKPIYVEITPRANCPVAASSAARRSDHSPLRTT
jgi:hypothetical protein